MENLEILKNIKDYMQWCIDRDYHKFTYNDLGWDFKCIDAINLIDDVLTQLTKQEKIIELMARFIDTELSSEYLSKVLKIDVKPLETYREDIKQYFEKKAEESE